MAKQTTVRRNKKLQKKVKEYTDKGWTQKEALSFVNGDDIRSGKKIDWKKADWS